MIIKYCNRCIGKPYTPNLDEEKCPVCNSTLKMESVDDYELEGREEIIFCGPTAAKEDELPVTSVFPFDFAAKEDESQKEQKNAEKKGRKTEWLPQTKNDETEIMEYEPAKSKAVSKDTVGSNEVCVRGRISQYSSTGKEDGNYRRLLPVRVYQALVYRQRLEDVLHRFTVRVKEERDIFGDEAYTDIPVNVHGTVSGGIQLTDNAEVEVRGKYRSGTLMASSIYIINNGHKSKVFFQRDVRTIMNSVIAAAMLMFLLYVSANTNGGFVESFVYMLQVWAVMAVVVTVLWLLLGVSRFSILSKMISGKRRSFPLLGILIVSLALAFLFVSTFGDFAGFGGFLAAELQSLVVVVVMIAIVIFLLKFLIIR